MVVLVIYNVRSAHNVGSMFRSADGLGISSLYLCGFTPYPEIPSDVRLPHQAKSVTNRIHKTALGAELSMPWRRYENLAKCVDKLRNDGFKIIGLEQTEGAISLKDYMPDGNLALVVGPEMDGLSPQELATMDEVIEIPMKGRKESFNVAVAAAIAMYTLTNF